MKRPDRQLFSQSAPVERKHFHFTQRGEFSRLFGLDWSRECHGFLRDCPSGAESGLAGWSHATWREIQ